MKISTTAEFCETVFEQDPYNRKIQDNWHLFKACITDVIEQYVPTLNYSN